MTTPLRAFEAFQRADLSQRMPPQILQILPQADRLVVFSTWQKTNFAEDGRELYLFFCTPDGQVTGKLLLGDEEDRFYNANNLQCDGDGNLYVWLQRHTYVLDPEGQFLGEITQPADGIVTLADGRVALYTESDDQEQWTFRVVDPKTCSLGPGTILYAAHKDWGYSIGQFFSGANGYDLLYASDLSLYGYRLGTPDQPGTGEHLLSWLNCDIDGSALLTVAPYQEGYLAVCGGAHFNSAPTDREYVILQPREPGEKAEVTALTLACRDLPQEVIQAVLRFNRQGSGVRVEIRDYGAVAAGVGMTAGLDRMTTDMITGKCPDLFYTSGMDEQMLIDRGLLEDLWPYIDADTELGAGTRWCSPSLTP